MASQRPVAAMLAAWFGSGFGHVAEAPSLSMPFLNHAMTSILPLPEGTAEKLVISVVQMGHDKKSEQLMPNRSTGFMSSVKKFRAIRNNLKIQNEPNTNNGKPGNMQGDKNDKHKCAAPKASTKDMRTLTS